MIINIKFNVWLIIGKIIQEKMTKISNLNDWTFTKSQSAKKQTGTIT